MVPHTIMMVLRKPSGQEAAGHHPQVHKHVRLPCVIARVDPTTVWLSQPSEQVASPKPTCSTSSIQGASCWPPWPATRSPRQGRGQCKQGTPERHVGGALDLQGEQPGRRSGGGGQVA